MLGKRRIKVPDRCNCGGELERMLKEADVLGEVRIWAHEYKADKDKKWEAKICFERKAGSKIEATGESNDVSQSLFKAIIEAKVLKDN